jgi:hypothetical protein
MIIETAKMNGVDPQAYLVDVLPVFRPPGAGIFRG